MALAKYLWLSRARPRLASARWWKAWGKRILTLHRLVQTTFTQGFLTNRGARIDTPAFLSRVTVNGDASKLAIGCDTFIGRVTLHLHDRIAIAETL